MSILNVDKIQPIGGGSTITVDATDIQATSATITASSFVGNVTGNVTGNATGLSGTPNISAGTITGSTGNFSSSISATGGTFSGDVSGNDIEIADSVRHTGDTNTKIRFPAADTITAETGGSERLRIDSSGKVGIGITNPISKIVVHGTGDGTTGSSNLADSVAAAGLFLKTHSGSSVGLSLGGRDSGGQYIQAAYQAATVSSVRDICINPHGGGVGIGTYAPNFGAAPGADTIVFGTSQTERLRIDSSGRVIIGATSVSPANSYSNNLVVSEASGDVGMQFVGNNSNSNYASLYFGDAGGSQRAFFESQLGANGNFTIGTAGTGPIRFTNSGGERLRITSAGDILIGNTNGGAEAINMVGGGGGILISRSASGSPNDGQTLGDIGLNSYSSSQTCSSADVLIRGQADGNHSGSSAGSALLLFTKPASTGPGSAPTERLRLDKDGNVIVGGTSVGANGSFSIQPSGHVRTILANGSGAGDTLFGAVGGVSNGFQINVDGSNNQNYYFHNGSSRTVSIRSTGKTEFGATNGNYGSNPQTVNIGSRAANIAGSLAIARGEGLGGGTGPYMEFVHGPDGGTQRTHSIYSYVGDFRIVADSNENMELHTGGSVTAKFDTNGQFNLFGGTANYIESADFRIYSNTSIASGYTGNLRLVARYNTNSTLISHSETGGTNGGSRFTFTKDCYIFVSVSQDVIGSVDSGYWSQRLVRNGSIEGYHIIRKSSQWDQMAWSQGISVNANGWIEIQWNGTANLNNVDGTSWSHYNFLVWQH